MTETAALPRATPAALTRARDDAALLLVCLIWGANFTFTKVAFAQLSPLAFTAVRFVAGTALLFGVVRVVEGPTPVPRGAQLWRMIWIGFFGNTLYQLGFVLGLAHSTATNTSLIIASSPAVVAILGAVTGIERTSLRGALGILLAVGGVVLIVLSRATGAVHASLADLFSVGATLAWSISTLGVREIRGMTPLQITAWTTLTGTPPLVLAAVPELLRVQWSEVGAAAWGGLAYAIVLSLVVGYVLWNRSVQSVGATRTTVYMCVTPVLAVLFAWLLLGERPGLPHVVGGMVIAAGVLLTRLSRQSQA
jgi:drug/metabolite transporter (DMT)-like permease